MSLPAKLICIILLFGMWAAASFSAQLTGIVTDSEGAAVGGAHVVVHWDRSGADVGLHSNVGIRQDLALVTDAKGEFRAQLPPGFYDIFVAAIAFSPDCRKIRIKPGENATYHVTLKVDPLVTSEMGDTFPH